MKELYLACKTIETKSIGAWGGGGEHNIQSKLT